jgi:predicted amidohydrolase YtcJ
MAMRDANGSGSVAADQVLLSSRVLTMSRTGPATAEAVALAGNRIVAVGGRELADGAGEGVRVLDFGDRPVLPGFVDTHVHFEIHSVAAATAVQIHTPPCASIGDMVETLKANVHLAERRGGWLVGEGNLMQDQRLAERRLPNRRDLDAVSTEVPIALRIGGHTTAMNTPGLERAERGFETKPTRSAVIERDGEGVPTGIAREVFYHLPIPWPEGEALADHLKSTLRDHFTAHGVTTIGEIPRTVGGVALMEQLTATGELPCRIRNFLRVGPMGTMDEMVELAHATAGRADPDLFRNQGIKLFADGGMTGATGAMLREYAIRPGSRGRLSFTGPHLRRLLERIFAAGLQPMVHATGERAQLAVCEALVDVSPGPLPPQRRPRLEHAGNLVSERRVMDAWADAGVLPVPNIGFLYSLGPAMPTYLGAYAEKGRFPLKTMAENGWPLISGSDITGDEPRGTNPLFGFWTAVARRGFTGELIEPEEAITVEQALRMYTIDAAAALGDEDLVGSLEPGKAADVVVLARDPRSVDPEDLEGVEVDFVFMDGRQVHARPGAAAPREAVPA